MTKRDREEFLVRSIEAGLPLYWARRVRSLAATHDRLAEAECNGDWPCDNGVRAVIECSRCGVGYVKSAMFRDHRAPKVTGPGEKEAKWIPLICKTCHVEDRIKAICNKWSVPVEFQGDPRGWTVKVGAR